MQKVKIVSTTYLFLVFVLAGCSTFSFDTDYEKGIDFSSYKTYSWHSPNAFNSSSSKYLDNDILDSRIRSRIDMTLKDKGYVLQASGNVDFHVNYSVSTEDRMDIKTYNNYNGIAPGFGYGGNYYRRGYYYGGVGHGYGVQSAETRTTHYTQGTLVLDIIRPSGGQLVWRGSAAGRLKNEQSRDEKEKAVQVVIEGILDAFPPEAK